MKFHELLGRLFQHDDPGATRARLATLTRGAPTGTPWMSIHPILLKRYRQRRAVRNAMANASRRRNRTAR